MVVCRNEEKTQQKIVDLQKDIAENHEKLEKLQNDLKQMDIDAKKLLDEHKQTMVRIHSFVWIFIPKIFRLKVYGPISEL